MKEAMHREEPVVALREEKSRRRIRTSCSVCTKHIWFHPMPVLEPEGVPEPRLSWTLCKECHQSLLTELERSPVLSPLRVRIAMGLVASERWPHAYPTQIKEYINDRRWIIFMAAGFVVAMLFHLAIIVMIPAIK